MWRTAEDAQCGLRQSFRVAQIIRKGCQKTGKHMLGSTDTIFDHSLRIFPIQPMSRAAIGRAKLLVFYEQLRYKAL
jgi:hypothetical protein